MDGKMKMKYSRVLLLSMFLVVLLCGSPSSANESWDDSGLILPVVLGYFMVADIGITLVNGLLWLGDREQTSTGWIGVATGGATIVLSATAPLWDEYDAEEALAILGAGVAIGGVTTAFGIVNKRHAEGNRRELETRTTSVTPSIFTDGNGELATGVVVRIGF